MIVQQTFLAYIILWSLFLNPDNGAPDILWDTNDDFIYVFIVVRIHHISSLHQMCYLVYFSCEEAEEGY